MQCSIEDKTEILWNLLYTIMIILSSGRRIATAGLKSNSRRKIHRFEIPVIPIVGYYH